MPPSASCSGRRSSREHAPEEGLTMPSGRFTRIVAFTILIILCVSAGVWLAPRVRSGGDASGPPAASAMVDAYRAEPGTALLHVLPPQGSSSDAMDAAWQRMIATHAAR